MMLKLKKQIASIPIIGKVARRVYRKFATAPAKPTKKPAVIQYIHSAADGVFTLNSQEIFSGSATVANTRAAQVIQDAITQIATEMPVIIFPSERGNEILIGIREDNAMQFTHLLSQLLSVDLQWQKLQANRPLGSHTALDLQINWVKGLAINIHASLFFDRDDAPNKMDCRDNKNTVMRHIHESLIPLMQQPGCYLASDMLGTEPTHQYMDPIDVIYTWVNHDDPDWQDVFKTAKDLQRKKTTGIDTPALPHQEDTDAESLARFTNRDELRYSMRSVAQYMPWVRKIFIFTNCARPDWLTTSDRIVWVQHDEVIPPDFLPTFNSHAIETSLHLIPDLAENFIYLNDDFFINQPIPRSFFFSPNGLSNANLEDYGTVNGTINPDHKDYMNAARNGVALLQTKFGKTPTRLHKHAPYALKKSVLAEIETHFPDSIRQTRAAQFRSMSDLSLVSFFYHHYAFCSGRGTQAGYRAKLIQNSSANLAHEMKLISQGGNARTFCLNDGADSHTDNDWNQIIFEFLQARFPIPIAEEITHVDP